MSLVKAFLILFSTLGQNSIGNGKAMMGIQLKGFNYNDFKEVPLKLEKVGVGLPKARFGCSWNFKGTISTQFPILSKLDDISYPKIR